MRHSEAPSCDKQTKRSTSRTIIIQAHLNQYGLYESKEISSVNPKQVDRNPATVGKTLPCSGENIGQKALNEKIVNLTQA